MLKLDEIRARCETATPGPWRNDEDYGVHMVNIPDAKRVHGYGYGDQGFICDIYDGEYHEYYNRIEQHANAEFIAHARTDIPALIAEVERLQKERDAAVIDLYQADDACAVCGKREGCTRAYASACFEWRGAQE